MDWEPISEAEIWDKINASYDRMSIEQKKFWAMIKKIPEKWQQEPWGNVGNGFWVVAVIGNSIIWYNDIEEGFNRSTYSKFGIINEYCFNQDNLEWQIQNLINEIKGL